MTDAPERIWIDRKGIPNSPKYVGTFYLDDAEDHETVDYIRRDLHEAAVAAARAEERAVWVSAIETYFDATAVMDVENYAARIRAEASK